MGQKLGKFACSSEEHGKVCFQAVLELVLVKVVRIHGALNKGVSDAKEIDQNPKAGSSGADRGDAFQSIRRECQRVNRDSEGV